MKPLRLNLRRLPRPVPALLGAWLLLAQAGCGQKGPLYLPDRKPEAVPAAPATAAPATAAPEEPADTPATRKAPRTPDPAAQR
jgi:predicted small lipoprotein YifL